MPTGNQNQGRRGDSRQNGGGGAQGGARQSGQNFGQEAQQGFEQVSNRLREGYEAVGEQAAHTYRRAEGTVARNPTTSVLLGFGLGVGLGLAISALLASEEETWAERYVPDSVRDLPHRLGKIRARDVARQVPDSWQDSFSHLSESIRDLPGAIARMMPSR